ncbi:N-acetylglucosamine-6-phosphate deacetylase [Trichuris trichiura]|uniref:N-acetylglucosamine-6-phosphate deacetylase n=1 Tax=Trichuris trichiura TaxID=36087 RepID=A0A077Z8M2_TRITR|nr:N-acetylglucosamine-6-phosphate deacetylase [Trichuris trichiura]
MVVQLTWNQADAKNLGNSLVRYTNCTLLRNRYFVDEDLWVEKGKVVDALNIFYEQKRMPDYKIDCKQLFIAPGFIDVQVNGGFGVNLSHDSEDLISQLDKLAMSLPQSGVTAFCPTLISSTSSFYQKALRSYKARPGGGCKGATVLGLHLEGPFINKSRAGAHQIEHIAEGFGENCEMLKSIYGRDLSEVCIITLAPELTNGMDAIRHLSKKGIRVSIGHCKASLSIGLRAIECGATGITHLFNAMSPFHHRDPCLPGVLACADNRKVYYGIIADEVHCHKEALALAHRVYPRGMMLVTDSVTAMGLGEGTHQLGDITFVVNGRRATVSDTNTLIGGITPMNDCIRSLIKATNCSGEIALNCASLHPAEFLGITNRKGKLQPGCDADFVLLDNEMNIMATYIEGNRIYEHVKRPPT